MKNRNKEKLEKLNTAIDDTNNTNNTNNTKEKTTMNTENGLDSLDNMLGNSGNALADAMDIFSSFNKNNVAPATYKLPKFGPIMKAVCTKVEVGAIKSGDNAGKPKLTLYVKTADDANVIATIPLSNESSFLAQMLDSFGLLDDEGKSSLTDPQQLVGLTMYATYKDNFYNGKHSGAIDKYKTLAEYEEAGSWTPEEEGAFGS